ncbi:hypothetical protein H072_1248 [Dactylellina haptotyla CBS 200.50]|uniref:Uncharacterized protein n=1 Tax=Dactylellina haptotyla (strain CBS 200.50) TaxID=1284197 RepID=S8CAH3_DACHA|nr:hypothetical protein H072_1248 [Dactylellina haptotyla CBS 200.50]
MKHNLLAIAFGISVSAAQAAETILGVYILSRHVFEVASDEVVNSQIRVVTTDDTVLMNSAQAFLQGLYPAVGSLASETLRNGTVISGVSGGYQLIPIHILDNGVNKEDTAWLQGTSKCTNAIKDSKNFEASEEFKNTKTETDSFYHSLESIWSGIFTPEESSFENAYAIYDIINYALLHNETIPSSDLLTEDAVFQLRTLADKQQWGFAYNESVPVRAIAGSAFAGDVLIHFEDVIQSKGSKPKVGVQFNAYGTFISFFGLAQLPAADSNFYGLPDYGSTMAFELFTYEAVESFPDVKDINVRFLFHNGSTVDGGELIAYPLFGKMETEMPWTTFADEMKGFAVATTDHWCWVCGIDGGICPVYNGTIEPLTHKTHHGLSGAVSGVVGALVTLFVVLVIEGLVVAIAGLAIVKKKDVKRAERGKGAESVSS